MPPRYDYDPMKPRQNLATALSILVMTATAWAGQFLIDFATLSDAAPGPWTSFEDLVQDTAVPLADVNEVDNDVMLTPLDDSFTANNPAGPNAAATYDGVLVPEEAGNDYLYKTDDAAGTSARMKIENLDPGDYNVTVFEGRTSDGNGQFGTIWVGDAEGNGEPAEENTGDFAGQSSTVAVTIEAGDALWYRHMEDNIGGISGMIVQTQSIGPRILTRTPVDNEGSVEVDRNLVATFDREIAAGTGNITVKNLTDATEIVFPVDDAQITIAEDVLTIDPAADLKEVKEYAIQIDATAIKDTSGVPFSGISDDSSWSFTTKPPIEDALALILIDLSDLAGSAEGWDLITTNVEDTPVTDTLGIDNDVTVTITGLGDQNNPAPPEGPALIDGVAVQLESLGDYVWGADGPGSTALFEFQGLDAGTYNISVFEGRTSDGNGQFGKIWVGSPGDEPEEENTGDFAGGSATLTSLQIGDRDSLFYRHQEDDIGGTSGLIIKLTARDDPIRLGIANQVESLEFDWDSEAGRLYSLLSSSDLAADPSLWESVNVPGSMAVGDTFQIAANPPTNVATIARPTDSTRFYRLSLLPDPPIFGDDFENGTGEWVAGAGPGDSGSSTWELGAPESGPGNANSGEAAWGTNLAGEYGNGSRTFLRSPQIDLTDVERASLEFYYFLDADDGEGGQVSILDANGDPLRAQLLIFPGENSTNEWRRSRIPLPADALGQTVVIEFEFLSDDNDANGDGWYIDDVVVE
ncbi:MAG: Ig-like domain-containing protein [Verrucomicrobiales bacterium]